jgi:hypothetical protein
MNESKGEMEMTRKTKQRQAAKQIREMLRNAQEGLMKKLDYAVSSGSVPDEYFEGDNYLLAKAVLDSWQRDRGYAPLNARTRKEFDNIHTCI